MMEFQPQLITGGEIFISGWSAHPDLAPRDSQNCPRAVAAASDSDRQMENASESPNLSPC